MEKYYTRACNFYYGSNSINKIKKKISLPLNGNKSISFDCIEIIKRNSNKIINISKINNLPKNIKKKVILDLKKITKKKKFHKLRFDKIPILMGVINATPDSFSDGGKFNSIKRGVNQAESLFNSGAKLIDIGGESTRPGSKPVQEKQEWRRVGKILKLLSKRLPISLDTRKSIIMERGIKLGVKLINDVSGLSFDKKTLYILKKYNIPFVIQHTQGDPEYMQKKPRYKNELLDIYDFFERKIKLLRLRGIKHNNIILDPGIGFGKNLKHNMSLICNISIFHSLGFPILVGNSRNRFIKEFSEKNDSKSRIGGTMASSIYLMMQGVQILRVHDVNEIMQGLKVFKKIINN